MISLTNESVKTRAERFLAVWEEFAPAEAFGEMTLAEFRAAIQPSFTTREEIGRIDHKRTVAAKRRDEADEVTRLMLELVANGVRGTRRFGADSAFYKALGFVPKSERRSGNTRKGKSTATTPVPVSQTV